MVLLLQLITLFSIALLPGSITPQSHDSQTALFSPAVSIIPREQLRPCIELIIQGDYAGAGEYIKNGVFSDELTKRFLSASILYARIGELETSEGSGEFFAETDWIIQDARRRISENPQDITARFYLGIALCYRAVVFKNSGNLWKAFKNGNSGKKELENCLTLAPDFPEPHLAIGSYRYWMSAMNFLRFLPFIPDERKDGIRQIAENVRPESISYTMSLNQLIWILLDYKDFEGAEEVAKKALELYPASRFFLYPAAITAQRLGKWYEAALLLNKVKAALEKDGLHNRYIWIKVTVKYAESLIETGGFEKAMLLCSEIRNCNVIHFEQKKSKALFKRALYIEKICEEFLKH